MEIYFTLLIAISVFLATNLDDLFILMSFFAIKDYNNFTVATGQYLGFFLIIMISLLAYFFKIIVPASYISLLGIFPIIIGFKYLWNYRKNIYKEMVMEKRFGFLKIDDNRKSGSLKGIFHISSITLSNGGDNLGVYIPLFLTMDILHVAITTATFFLMVGLWCIMAYLMVENEIFGKKIRMYSNAIFPFILILIGIWILTGINHILTI
jgi:cadmium resistance protein CadD (predicted permease)